MTTTTTTTPATTTWQQRLKDVIGTRGYENCMRRSLQTVILYEAKRCVAHRLPALRPFQRKAAFIDQAQALLESVDFLYPHQKSEVLWRTASSKEPMDADIAWKREKGIDKEIGILARKMKPFVDKAKTHEEAMGMLVQDLYESLTGFTGKPYPLNWEHAHNHCIMAYRMYFHFDTFDPDFPAPVSPREIEVPLERPKQVMKKATSANDGDDGEPHLDVAELLGESKNIEQDRRKVLQEVREHLELLKEFEGVISDEDLAKRKRDLFMALPPAPPLPGITSADASATPTAKKAKTEAPLATTAVVNTI